MAQEDKIQIKIDKQNVKGVRFLENNQYELDVNSGTFTFPELINTNKRYFTFLMELQEEHSGTFQLMFYARGEEEPRFTIRFGVLPSLETQFCFDLQWLDGHVLFPGNTPPALKLVCHGSRITPEEIEKVVLASYPCFHKVKIKLKDLYLTMEKPKFIVPNKKMVDEFGQSKNKEWSGKIKDLTQLQNRLNELLKCNTAPLDDRTIYGGCKSLKLQDETGYFSRIKKDGRWYLTDPLGYAFFSVGSDCVVSDMDGRIDNIENLLDFIPPQDSDLYNMFIKQRNLSDNRIIEKYISFVSMNLYRAWGKQWRKNWESMIQNIFLYNGLNTLGNWSDSKLFGKLSIPYVTSLPNFPDTNVHIFRDFPDVFSEEYSNQAEICAKALEQYKDDPMMIGYFLRNEPNWAFVNNLVIADEVLRNPQKTCCKDRLINFIKQKYKTIEQLNNAYNMNLNSFDDLYSPIIDLSKQSPQANEDMRAFSRKMLQAYIEIPSKACRKVDSNHMILGMRWAWISDADIVSGWENFDVFSINCYSIDPTEYIEQVKNLGVDLPVMIGEFHFGAIDAGPTATGLEAVNTQYDRGKAYQYYCERVAAHPYGVGCHYFQLYDQFCLGRFDGENYNIGLLDVCSQPYDDMMKSVRICNQRIYAIMTKKYEPTDEKPQAIPMIAY